MENWRPVPGYEGLYEVSDQGRVKSIKRNKLLNVTKSNSYYSVVLCKNSSPKQVNLRAILDATFENHFMKDNSLDDLPSEVWADIPNFEGHYQVSNMGRVKSLLRTRKSKLGNESTVLPRIRAGSLDQDGYLMLVLYRDDYQETWLIHRLVAALFIPNPDNLPQVNHKDGNPANNKVSNLEWCTNMQNIKASIELGTRNPHRYSRKVIRYPDLAKFDSVASVARLTNTNYNRVLRDLRYDNLFVHGQYSYKLMEDN